LEDSGTDEELQDPVTNQELEDDSGAAHELEIDDAGATSELDVELG
jgi:hypothetical protein